jgi:hypothetical protein
MDTANTNKTYKGINMDTANTNKIYKGINMDTANTNKTHFHIHNKTSFLPYYLFNEVPVYQSIRI